MLDEASCAEVWEPVRTLELSVRAKAYCGFGPGLCGVVGDCLLVCFGVGAKLCAALFCEVDGGSWHEHLWGDSAGHATVDRERIQPENRAFRHSGYHYVWEFLERKGVPFASDSLFHHLDLSFNFRNMFI